MAKPTLVGLNCTLMTHVPLAAITRSGVQVVVAAAITNGPVTVSGVAPSVIDTPVLLVRVIFVAGLGTPTAVVANVTAVGESATLLLPVPRQADELRSRGIAIVDHHRSSLRACGLRREVHA